MNRPCGRAIEASISIPFFSFPQEALVSRISKKIEVLKAEQICLREETKLNDDLGRQISVRVMQLAQPNECEKYKLHVEETDKIASLIFGLAGRLAKTENSLLLLGGDGDGGGDAQKEKVRLEMKFRFHEVLKHEGRHSPFPLCLAI